MPKLGIWGRALALRLPAHIVQTAQLKPGMTCTCRLLDDGSIRVKVTGLQAQSAATAPPSVMDASVDNGDKTW